MTCFLRARAPEREVRGWEQGVDCVAALGAAEGARGGNDHCKCRFSVAVGSDPSPAKEGRGGAEDRITGG